MQIGSILGNGYSGGGESRLIGRPLAGMASSTNRESLQINYFRTTVETPPKKFERFNAPNWRGGSNLTAKRDIFEVSLYTLKSYLIY